MKSRTILHGGKSFRRFGTGTGRSKVRLRTTGVIGASIGSAASVYILVAITGYLSFGNKVAGNIVGMCTSL